jgi:hypothetical protein
MRTTILFIFLLILFTVVNSIVKIDEGRFKVIVIALLITILDLTRQNENSKN